ncbi:MAG: hypothetical protein R2867_42560 [Caldilineaceae bacterium]
MQAATEIGIPIINCGPGGKTDDPSTLQQTLDELGALNLQMAEKYGVTLCVKAHMLARRCTTHRRPKKSWMRSLYYNFGIDMDPSHIYRMMGIPKNRGDCRRDFA